MKLVVRLNISPYFATYRAERTGEKEIQNNAPNYQSS